MIRLSFFAGALFASLALVSCGGEGQGDAAGEHAAEAPAGRVREQNLDTLVLSAEAEARLGIRTGIVEHRAVPNARLLGGEVIVPPGRSVTVAAPVAARVAAPRTGEVAAGARVASGAPVFGITPLLLSADSLASLAAAQVEAAGAADGARAQTEAARIALARAEDLLAKGSGSQREVDDARARLALAEASLRGAEARRELASQLLEGGGQATAVPVAAPFGGVLTEIHAAPGQIVAAGAPLFSLAALELLWVRVPVYAGDLARVDRAGEARVGPPGERPEGAAVPARPVAAPPSADVNAATVDLVYEIDAAKVALDAAPAAFVPGQRVAVHVPLLGEAKNLVAPWSAVLHDVHGGTWVYVKSGEHAYTRTRVEVERVSAAFAVLAAGPRPGAEVVSDGAAELFSIEFGAAK